MRPVRLYSVVVYVEKNVAGSRGRVPGQGVRGAKPPAAEIFLAFGCAMKATNLPVFKQLPPPPLLSLAPPMVANRCSMREKFDFS